MRDVRLGTLVLNICISLGPWIVAAVPAQPAQYPGRALVPVSTSRGLASASVSVLATATPLKLIRNRAWNTTSLVNNSTTTSASSVSRDLSSSSVSRDLSSSSVSRDLSSSSVSSDLSSSSVSSGPPSSSTPSDLESQFGPRDPPSNAHIIKLAEIVVPSVGVPLLATLWQSQRIANFLWGKPIKKRLGPRMKLLRERLDEFERREFERQRQREPQSEKLMKYRDWEIWETRAMLMAEARNPGLFSEAQKKRITEIEADSGESIWNGYKGRKYKGRECPGHPFCRDWPGEPPGSELPPAPEAPDGLDPTPSGSEPPSDPNPPLDTEPPPNSEPPSDPEPPSNPEPPSDPIPPSNPEPPSDPEPPSAPIPPSNPEPPSAPIPPSNPEPPSDPIPPSDPEPPRPQYATEESIRLANQLPPLPKEKYFKGPLRKLGLIRLVPDDYRRLPLDAKIVYMTKNFENVWLQKLRYKNGEPAAVGRFNQKLGDWDFDENRNFRSYKELTGQSMVEGRYPPGFDYPKFKKEFADVTDQLYWLDVMEFLEKQRVHTRWRSEPQHNPLPPPAQKHDPKHRHKHHHPHNRPVKRPQDRPQDRVQCSAPWNWEAACF